MPGAGAGPAPTLGAPDRGVSGAGGATCGVPAGAIGFDRGFVCLVETLIVGRVRVSGGSAAGPGCAGTGAATGASAGAGVWAGTFCANPGINATANAIRRNAVDTSLPEGCADMSVPSG